MNVIVTTYTIAICWYESEKESEREFAGTRAGKQEQIVEFIFERKKYERARERENKWLRLVSCLPHARTNKDRSTMIPAGLACPPSLSFFLSFFLFPSSIHPLTSQLWCKCTWVTVRSRPGRFSWTRPHTGSLICLLPLSKKREKRRSFFLWRWQPALPQD